MTEFRCDIPVHVSFGWKLSSVIVVELVKWELFPSVELELLEDEFDVVEELEDGLEDEEDPFEELEDKNGGIWIGIWSPSIGHISTLSSIWLAGLW